MGIQTPTRPWKRPARRGSVFVEFWFFFICWLALAGVKRH